MTHPPLPLSESDLITEVCVMLHITWCLSLFTDGFEWNWHRRNHRSTHYYDTSAFCTTNILMDAIGAEVCV